MRKRLRQKPGESLGAWTERLARACVGMTSEELGEVLHEVSVNSYIQGSGDTHKLLTKYRNET
jgi:hypothetical protein